MDIEKFILGNPYFMVSYYDEKIKLPLLETYVFIGKNILKNEREELWYFKDPDAFISEGYNLTEEMFETSVCLGVDTIELMLDYEELIEKLKLIWHRTH